MLLRLARPVPRLRGSSYIVFLLFFYVAYENPYHVYQNLSRD